jgi:hypothetical protein
VVNVDLSPAELEDIARRVYARRLHGDLMWKRTYKAVAPERLLEVAKQVWEKAKAEARVRCEICDLNLPTEYALELHYTRQSHLDKVAGVSKPAQPEWRVQAEGSNWGPLFDIGQRGGLPITTKIHLNQCGVKVGRWT